MSLLSRSGLGVAPVFLLALGCAVGDPGTSFSGGSLTFGDPTAANTQGDAGSATDTDDGDSATSVATGNDSADSADTAASADSGGTCTPSDEMCNGLDDDCDGEIDNGNPGGAEACNTGMPGVCSTGTSVCEAGAIACIADVAPSPELCDGLDNDCNGQADDGNPDAGGACNTGMPGVCADGTGSCAGGGLECIPDTAASNEVCDGLDNDCDGQVDDGNPGGGGGCSTGMPGICSSGTQQCTGGALSCQQNNAPVAEICANGLDDDCDGAIDDGCNNCAHDICLTGVALVNGCDPCVTSICAVDPFCCSTSWDGICVGEVGSVCGIVC
ncbi:MopE-related protein [Paraliomyxa miuraensis]|uniref:MopE-related protein n=1 Tax=Paraliomyxa miuraensis TaxID=376150 RepID=UPI0022528EE1|nr:MopE-related protein [Paraliomyxa miuraensis]MCX4246884.1 MopE-related protein [Paraliomyxa miuraensis]